MSAVYGTKKFDRTQILRDAHIVSAADVGLSSQLASQLLLADIASQVCGRRIHLVLWPNGCAAMLDSEPGTAQRAELLVNTYEACLNNRIGPVVLGG